MRRLGSASFSSWLLAVMVGGCQLRVDVSSRGNLSGSGGTAGTGGEITESGGSGGAGAGGAADGGSGGSSGAGGASGSGGAGDGSVTPIAGCIESSYGGHSYAFCPTAVTSPVARDDCRARGMTMIGINDAAENAWVYDQGMALAGSANHHLLLGGSDALVENEWRWPDGTLFSIGSTVASGAYANWHPGEPNDATGPEPAMRMYLKTAASDWADVPEDLQDFFGCESP